MAEAKLNSSRGNAQLCVTSTACCEDVDGKWIIIDLEYKGTIWTLDKSPDVEFRLANILAHATTLERLVASIERWICLPLQNLAHTPFEAEADFGRCYGETILLRFGESQEIITEGKPVFSLIVNSGLLAFEQRFVVDPSCLDIFRTGLKELLSSPS